ncbi:MAG: rhodanese-like domain-containing protein [Chloroflexi bacterium]|nr:rhodanese-like domain-containing protein [Chloroflexota bacterium]
MKSKLLLVLSLTLLILTACRGGGEAAVAEPLAAAEESLTLGPSINVKTVNAIKDRDDVFLIDVREQWEYDEKHIPDITLIPLGDIPARIKELPADKEIIITCRSGNRSGQATAFLRDQGLENVHNMEGGIVAWEAAGFPVE